MPSARHRASARPAALLRSSKLARVTGLATIVTATVLTVGLSSGASERELTPSPENAAASVGRLDQQALRESREQRASRTAQRVRLEPQPVGHKFATEPLNVWTKPREQGRKVGLVKWGTRLAVTGQTVGHWAEVLMPRPAAGKRGKAAPGQRGPQVRWVNADFLADKKPKPEPTTGPTAGITGAACPDGSSIESGLTTAADRVYRAVCAAFPQPTTYGGLDPHGEHVDGRAIDIMISGAVGWQIAEWLRAHAGELQIRDIIYSQRIWTPDRAGEGWRYMSDRGSVTANHYDHVHVAVY